MFETLIYERRSNIISKDYKKRLLQFICYCFTFIYSCIRLSFFMMGWIKPAVKTCLQHLFCLKVFSIRFFIVFPHFYDCRIISSFLTVLSNEVLLIKETLVGLFNPSCKIRISIINLKLESLKLMKLRMTISHRINTANIS